MASTRQLAAIMFTDIVGYTRMMGKDEKQTLKLIHQNRSIHVEMIKQHQGKLLKEMGNGTLAQFDNATDAVLCAKDIQKKVRLNIKPQNFNSIVKRNT